MDTNPILKIIKKDVGNVGKLKLGLNQNKMRINFFYSIPYDRMLTEMSGLEYSKKQSLEAKECMLQIDKNWRKIENRAIKEVEKVSKLKFKYDVTCFLVKNMAYNALSHPLTIKIHNDYDKFN